jgi:hypothetical protein
LTKQDFSKLLEREKQKGYTTYYITVSSKRYVYRVGISSGEKSKFKGLLTQKALGLKYEPLIGITIF